LTPISELDPNSLAKIVSHIYIENVFLNFIIVVITTTAANNIMIDDIITRKDELFNRFMKSPAVVFSVVNVDVTVLVDVVVVMSGTVLVKFNSLVVITVAIIVVGNI